MFDNETALECVRVTGKCRDRSMQHTCSRHAACLCQGSGYALESTHGI